MFKGILRRTVYRNYEYDLQNLLIKLMGNLPIWQMLCFHLLNITIYIFPLIPFLAMALFSTDIRLSLSAQIAFMAFIIIYCVSFAILLQLIENSLRQVSDAFVKKLYLKFVAKKGRAISRRDFRKIKNENPHLYKAILTLKCRKNCFQTCIDLCYFLQKGSVQFIKVPNFNDFKLIPRKVTLHILYVNKGWAFDTNSGRQFRLKKLHKIYKVQSCQEFSFSELFGPNAFIDPSKKPVSPDWTYEENLLQWFEVQFLP